MKVGTSEQFKWLNGILAVVFILNVVDGILTLVWYFTGRAKEANPLLAQVISLHPVLFICVKISLVGLGSYLLWKYRKKALAVIGIFMAFLAYYTILLIHVRAMNVRIILKAFE